MELDRKPFIMCDLGFLLSKFPVCSHYRLFDYHDLGGCYTALDVF